jgi:hypothetical protein
MTGATDVYNVTCVTEWTNKLHQTNSKALAKSQTITPTFIFQIIDLNTLSVSLKAASSVEIPFLKPYFSVSSLLLVCRCWLTRYLCRIHPPPPKKNCCRRSYTITCTTVHYTSADTYEGTFKDNVYLSIWNLHCIVLNLLGSFVHLPVLTHRGFPAKYCPT